LLFDFFTRNNCFVVNSLSIVSFVLLCVYLDKLTGNRIVSNFILMLAILLIDIGKDIKRKQFTASFREYIQVPLLCVCIIGNVFFPSTPPSSSPGFVFSDKLEADAKASLVNITTHRENINLALYQMEVKLNVLIQEADLGRYYYDPYLPYPRDAKLRENVLAYERSLAANFTDIHLRLHYHYKFQSLRDICLANARSCLPSVETLAESDVSLFALCFFDIRMTIDLYRHYHSYDDSAIVLPELTSELMS
jgi:hypothetical protein